MSIKLEVQVKIWQSEFNDQWYCDVYTRQDKQTRHWEATDLKGILLELNKMFPTLFIKPSAEAPIT